MVTRFEYNQMRGTFLGLKATVQHCREQLADVNGVRCLQKWAMRQLNIYGHQLAQQRQKYMALCERIKKEGIEQ